MNPPHQTTSSITPLSRKFRSLIWQYLDCDLPRTALFYAERYFYSFPDPQGPSHDARHLLATSLLRCNQVHSAQHLVKDLNCLACTEVFAECCMKLGRFRQGQDALSKCVGKARNDPLPSEPRAIPDESVILCKAGTLALKGNLHDQAVQYFQQALALNPFLWEAVDGLCKLGKCPEIDLLIRPQTAVTQLFAAPPPPGHIRFDTKTAPVPTFAPPPQPSGGGFFTPAPNHANNGKGPQFNPLYTSGSNGPLQPFRLDAAFANGRDSIATVDSSFHGDTTFALNGLDGNPPFLPPKPEDGRTSHKRTRAQMASGSTLPKVEKK
ncbi:anaphase-promoting complex subunit cdc27, partial [Tulasnella sp. 427]